MSAPFLSISPPTSPFNLSPPLSPKSYYSHVSSSSVSPLTPEPGVVFDEQNDLSRLSGFPQASGFNFDVNNNDPSPISPSGVAQLSNQPLGRPASNIVVVIPPGGVYRERDVEASVEAPPPYERYTRHPMPVGGLAATRASIAAGQFPTDPGFPVPAYGRGRHGHFASLGAPGVNVPRSFSGRRQPYPLTLSDTRGPGNHPRQKKQASWRIFGASDSIDEGEKKPLTKKGKWCIAIVVVTILIAVAIIGALVGTMKPKEASNAVVSDDVSGFPALPAGLVAITPQGAAETPAASCVQPKTLWSCILPPDTLFPHIESSGNLLPKFMFTIKVRNSTTDANPETSVAQWAPFPERTPNDTAYASLSGVDGIQSDNKSGEKTPFYLSLQTNQNSIITRDIEDTPEDMEIAREESPKQDTGRRRFRRSMSKRQAQVPSMMLPLELRNQPLRLFDRDLDTEHYGFFVYFKKTIHVLAASPADVNNLTAAADANGGVSAIVSNSEQVTWEDTRFRVAIWTKKRASGQMNVIGDRGQRLPNTPSDDSFPYPVTVIEDRHGEKGDVWYGKKNFQARSIVEEDADTTCSCQWRNWRAGITG